MARLISRRGAFVKLLMFLFNFTVSNQEEINAHYLGAKQQVFGANQAWNYFYFCNSCGRGLYWTVDGVPAATHLYTDNIGSVASQTEQNDSSSLWLTSVVLSKWKYNSNTCFDVLLIITKSGVSGQVICHGIQTQSVATGPLLRLSSSTPSNLNDLIELDSIFGWPIIRNNNTLITQVLMCYSRETTQLWERNEQSAGSFNEVDNVGSKYIRLHSIDSSIVAREAVLLVKKPNVEFKSVLILSDFNSSLRFSVTCLSDTATSNLNLVNIPSSMMNAVQTSEASIVSTEKENKIDTTAMSSISETSSMHSNAAGWLFILIAVPVIITSIVGGIFILILICFMFPHLQHALHIFTFKRKNKWM